MAAGVASSCVARATQLLKLVESRAMDKAKKTEIEAAAFRRLVAHLQERKDVQNIDLMDLAGFCRNCLSKWYLAAAQEVGEPMDIDEAKHTVYGMPYAEWKANWQK